MPTSEDGWANLQKARAFVRQRYPYFYSTVLGFIPTEVVDIGTLFVTDTMVLGVDMEWFATLPVDVAGGCLIHEVMHILRDMSRIAVFPDSDRAGVAFDIPINDDLKKFGIKLPDWVIYSSTYKLPPGLTGEKYYELLEGVKLPQSGKIGAGKCGSCNKHSKDPVAPIKGRSQKEVQHFKRIGIAEVGEYINKIDPGSVPGTWREFLKSEDEEAVIPWASVWRPSVGRAIGQIRSGQADYSFRRPAKRSYVTGILRPSLIEYSPVVGVIEDSSISMGNKQMIENRVEIVNAMRQLSIDEVWFINADTKVQTAPKKVPISALLKLPAVGRGGTDFRPAIDAMMKIRPKPELIIYSTDGGGKAPDRKPPGVEFIWLLAPGEWTVSPCDWGIQILTSNDSRDRKKYKILSAAKR